MPAPGRSCDRAGTRAPLRSTDQAAGARPVPSRGMRAAVLRGVNEKFDIRDDVSLVDPGPGDVLVELTACGVCHSDLSVLNGTMGAGTFPAILGHEGAGRVIGVGAGVDALKEGDAVVLAFAPPCGACRRCLGGQPN